MHYIGPTEDQLTIRFPRDLNKALKERAARMNRKPSEVVRIAVAEFLQISISTRGWKWVHAILGLLFILVGIYALWNPYDTFNTLAALVGFFLLVKGVFDISVAFITKEEFELWWLQLIVGLIEIMLAFWVAGNFRKEAILLVVYVGIIALARGISEIFIAFKLKGLRRRLAAA